MPPPRESRDSSSERVRSNISCRSGLSDFGGRASDQSLVPLALTILGPIIVNILLFHGLMNPAGNRTGVFVTIFWGVVFVSVVRRSPES